MIISNITRVCGYIVNNLTLTTSEAQSATWGKTMRHNNINRVSGYRPNRKGIFLLLSPQSE